MQVTTNPSWGTKLDIDDDSPYEFQKEVTSTEAQIHALSFYA